MSRSRKCIILEVGQVKEFGYVNPALSPGRYDISFFFFFFLMPQRVTGQNVDKPKRRQPKRRQTETSTNRNVDKPKRRQAKTSTDQNVDKPKRRQTKTSTSQNVDRPKRRQTKTATNQNVDKPKRRQTEISTFHCRLFVFITCGTFFICICTWYIIDRMYSIHRTHDYTILCNYSKTWRSLFKTDNKQNVCTYVV